MDQHDTIMDTQELADWLSVSIQTIDKWRKLEGLPALPLPSRTVRFLKRDVMDWLKGRNSPETATRRRGGH